VRNKPYNFNFLKITEKQNLSDQRSNWSSSKEILFHPENQESRNEGTFRMLDTVSHLFKLEFLNFGSVVQNIIFETLMLH